MHLIYRLSDAEYHKYRDHLLALDTDSRYLRFGYHISNEGIEALYQTMLSNIRCHKIFVIENNDLTVVAAGHIALEGSETELAFSVLKEYRNQGIGGALIDRCIKWCQNRNITTGTMVCLTSNYAIRHLAGKHGLLVRHGSETQAQIDIPKSNHISITQEAVESQLARIDHMRKIQMNFFKNATNNLLFNKN